MTTWSGHHPQNFKFTSTMVLLIATLVSMPVCAVLGQDPADKANSLLESLKKRSPEERWQRVKKQYSVDPAATQRSTPPRVTENQPKGLAEDELPPSPARTNLIPLLTVLPVDTSNDWVLPSRDPVALMEELQSEPVPKPAEQVTSKPAEPQKPADTQPALPAAVAPNSDAPDPNMKQGPSGDVIVGESRPPTERKITDINPYYDRSRDDDIREFAMVKGKEFGLQYKHRDYVQRSFPQVLLPWEASQYFYHPLYFSDPALERSGHTYHPLVQPIASVARFGTQFVMLPYQMTIDPPFEIVTQVGFDRPGDVTPKLLYQIPWNTQAALVEAGAIAGLYFVIP